MKKLVDTILIYIDPQLKRELKAKLSLSGKTFSEWFREQARKYLRSKMS